MQLPGKFFIFSSIKKVDSEESSLGEGGKEALQ